MPGTKRSGRKPAAVEKARQEKSVALMKDVELLRDRFGSLLPEKEDILEYLVTALKETGYEQLGKRDEILLNQFTDIIHEKFFLEKCVDECGWDSDVLGKVSLFSAIKQNQKHLLHMVKEFSFSFILRDPEKEEEFKEKMKTITPEVKQVRNAKKSSKAKEITINDKRASVLSKL